MAYGPGSYGSWSGYVKSTYKTPKPQSFSNVSVAPGHDPNTLQKTTGAAWPDPKPELAHDSIYQGAYDLAQRGRGSAQGDYTYGTTRGQSDYGLQRDPAGNVSTIDPSSPLYNPFSKMALLRQHFENSQRGNTNSYAARGQLYSGALQNAQTETGRSYNQDVSQTIGGFTDYMHGLDRGLDTANLNADSAIGQAGADEIPRHIDDAAVPQVYDASNLPPGVAAQGVKLGAGIRVVVINGKPVRFLKPGESI